VSAAGGGRPGPGDPAAPLRIVVADDQATVREGLVVLLGLLPDIDVVGSAADGEEALRLVAAERPDAILLDLHMPVLDGIETTRRLSERHPEIAVVVLTTYDDDASILAALQAGARSLLTKNADRADIAQALRSAAMGLSVLDPTVRAALLAAASGAAAHASDRDRDRERSAQARVPQKPPDGLTHREAEILCMIARGMTNPDIAAALYLSVRTVKSHVNRIFAKTGSPDRPAAIRYARSHELG
jgi:DNA-binding NarL/FixJ family response regulator